MFVLYICIWYLLIFTNQNKVDHILKCPEGVNFVHSCLTINFWKSKVIFKFYISTQPPILSIKSEITKTWNRRGDTWQWYCSATDGSFPRSIEFNCRGSPYHIIKHTLQTVLHLYKKYSEYVIVYAVIIHQNNIFLIQI